MRNNGPVTQQEYLPSSDVALVSCTDLDSRIRYCNPAFIEASGFSAEELIGQPHNLIRHPDMPAEAFRDMWATLKAGEPWTALVKNRRKDGDHYWVRANVTPILESGQVTGYMSVRTIPGRDEVRAAEALYERMRAEAASRQITLRLQRGELVSTQWFNRLGAWLKPTFGWRLAYSVTGGTAAVTAATAMVASWQPVAALAAGGLLSVLLGLWIRQQATQPLRLATTVARRACAGDLRASMTSPRPDEVGNLARAMTQLNVNLQAIVGDVRRHADGIAQASQDIAHGNADLGGRTETQAANLEETAAAVEEISGTVRQTAGTVGEAAEVAQRAADDAQRSGESARELAGRMHELRQAAERIREIIGTIDGISFQTNLLALNAAVEAARAGEHGRGFAVVAGEVRALAQHTRKAAGEIKQLIEDITARVAAGNALADATGNATLQAAEAVRRMHTMISEIGQATREQAKGTEQVNLAVADIDRLTQENASMVERLGNTAQALRQQTVDMAQAVRIFRG